MTGSWNTLGYEAGDDPGNHRPRGKGENLGGGPGLACGGEGTLEDRGRATLEDGRDIAARQRCRELAAEVGERVAAARLQAVGNGVGGVGDGPLV